MINNFIEYVSGILGIEHKDAVALLVPISIFLAGILINAFIKSISNHNQRILIRELFKINLRKLILGVNRQGLSFQQLYPQLTIENSGSYVFKPVSISAISIFDGIKYEDMYKAFFKGPLNFFSRNKQQRLIAFSDFYAVMAYLSHYHQIALSEIYTFEKTGAEYQNLLNGALGQVSEITETFRFNMHETRIEKGGLSDYFFELENILESYQSKKDYTHFINTEINLVQKILELNRKKYQYYEGI
ncbi:MAG: hypothetical protein JWR50_2635 [Mucilaginibacter sp.]|nr:hypothetical protein [Mucilaginibacter sp.]